MSSGNGSQMSQHTPGPWTVVPCDQDTAWECIEARGAHLACVSRAENPVNSRLIAAAPMLLEALGVGLAALERIALVVPREQMLGVEAKLRAAIRAAKGEDNG